MDVTKDIVKVCGIEVEGDFAQAIKEAVVMAHLPYTVKIHKSKHRQAQDWCREQLGPRWSAMDNRTGTWCCFWAGNKDFEHFDFYFLNEKDMIWAALKWS